MASDLTREDLERMRWLLDRVEATLAAYEATAAMLGRMEHLEPLLEMAGEFPRLIALVEELAWCCTQDHGTCEAKEYGRFLHLMEQARALLPEGGDDEE